MTAAAEPWVYVDTTGSGPVMTWYLSPDVDRGDWCIRVTAAGVQSTGAQQPEWLEDARFAHQVMTADPNADLHHHVQRRHIARWGRDARGVIIAGHTEL